MSVANVEQWTIEEICFLPTDILLHMETESKYCLLKSVPIHIIFLKKILKHIGQHAWRLLLARKICIQRDKSYW